MRRYASEVRWRDLVGDAHVLRVIDAGHPQAQHVEAPLFAMTSAGSTPLPSDFDILRPSPSTVKPQCM